MSQKRPATTEHVKFEICDSGVGISKEKLPYIFALFESGINELEQNFNESNHKNKSNGAKIGLPIC